MRKILVLLIIVFSAMSVFASTKIPIKITKIFDGDTVQATINNNKFTVRLIGIDCYETSAIHRAYTQAYKNNLSIDEVVSCGISSKKYLEKLYLENKEDIFLDFMGIDKYGRALGVLYFGDLNVNDDLVKNGACLIYNYKE